MDVHGLRVAILRLLADPGSGKRVIREANQLLDNGAVEEVRAWLGTGYRPARFEGDRGAVFRLLADPGHQ
ncbi:hypothetical protein [Streptomyces sp. KMM 9044]|uniref:hypothetical protein n=1 Tax=Streptomyces sp. KMM 9044 TaxID=2744474 RepID=UPI002F3E85EB